MKTRSVVAPALDVALGFGATVIFVLGYGSLLSWLWPYIFEADWPFLGSDAAVGMMRARMFDAILGGAFGMLLGTSAHRGWIRRPSANAFALAFGIILYWSLDAYGASNVRSALLETPLPWSLLALGAVTVLFNRH